MGWSKLSAEAKSAIAMIALCLFMGPFVAMIMFIKRVDMFEVFGFRGPYFWILPAWMAALVLAAVYAAWSAGIPSVRLWLFRLHPLKLLAVILAVLAATLEELLFRKMLMDWLQRLGEDEAVQVIASGIAFGAMHAVWGGLKGSWQTATGAVVATTFLGLGLALVYLVGGRSLAPCIISHFLVTALIEPGLLIAAFGGGLRVRQ